MSILGFWRRRRIARSEVQEAVSVLMEEAPRYQHDDLRWLRRIDEQMRQRFPGDDRRSQEQREQALRYFLLTHGLLRTYLEVYECLAAFNLKRVSVDDLRRLASQSKGDAVLLVLLRLEEQGDHEAVKKVRVAVGRLERGHADMKELYRDTGLSLHQVRSLQKLLTIRMP
jgi:hypothetical protein